MSDPIVSRRVASGKLTLVEFHGDSLLGVILEDGEYVAIKPMSDAMGLSWPSQWKRLQRDPILRESIVVMAMPWGTSAVETTFLRIDLVNGWLFGIDESRVKPEARETVLTYKRECYRVLYEHFHGKKIRPGQPEMSDQLKKELVNTAIRCGGARAGAEAWVHYGLAPLPAITHALAQGEFRFQIDVPPMSSDTEA
jgi:hypothetical protein